MTRSAGFPFDRVAMLSLAISLTIFGLHLYYFCYPLFNEWDWTCRIGDNLLMQISKTGLFNSLLECKLIAAFFLGLTCIANRGQADRRRTLRQALKVTGMGIALYFGSFLVFARLGSLTATSCWYILFTTAGWLLMLVGGIRVKRLMLSPRTSTDPYNKAHSGFPQEERQITSEYSLHLQGQYQLEGRQRYSWINLVNPRRGILVIGSPGSGKSRFIIEPLLRQCMERGHTLFLYDFKYDSLSRLAWQLFNHYRDRYLGTAFYSINFTDISRSHRCNVLEPSTLRQVSDAIGASRTIMLSLNRTWVQQEGKFFVESPINLLAAAIWYLRQYDEGKYCTLPHVIELLQAPYNKLLTVLRSQPEVRTLIQPFIDAYQNKSFEMLDGQIASARIPLARLASPEVYYILTGNDLNMYLNDPAAPKILCLGGDPTRREALAPILSLYIDQVGKLCNAPDRRPFVLLCDEFATVRATNVLTTFATARSNNVIPILAVQDISQLRIQYSRDESDLLLNISGNFFCGQTGGETAKWVSERFPKILKDRPSVSTNSADTAISVTPQWEEAVTPATLAMLSSGEFVGVTADDPDVGLELKGFHARIIRKEPELKAGRLPLIHHPLDTAQLKTAFAQISHDIAMLVDKECQRLTKDADKSSLIVK